jgi:hypothetical protein
MSDKKAVNHPELLPSRRIALPYWRKLLACVLTALAAKDAENSR